VPFEIPDEKPGDFDIRVETAGNPESRDRSHFRRLIQDARAGVRAKDAFGLGTGPSRQDWLKLSRSLSGSQNVIPVLDRMSPLNETAAAFDRPRGLDPAWGW
jgi:hypothetical protein